jgi:membrane-associated phospholipid phosphatase
MNANAFPSMHVASAVFACFWLNKQLSQMNAPVVVYIAVVIWCIGIVYSTMAIRQHLFVDVAGGFILGVLMAIITLKHYSKRLCSTIPKK